MHTSQLSGARRILRHTRLVLGLATLSLLFACGGTRSSEKEMNPEALRLHTNLLRFAQVYAASIVAVADDIAEATDDRTVREMTIRWKLSSIPTMHRVVAHEDPRTALVDAWMICTRQLINLEEGPLKTVFGDQQSLALAKVKQLQDRIEVIGREALPAAAFKEAEAELEAFARGEPLAGKFGSQLLRSSNRVTESTNPGFFHLLSIPIGGLSETAQAVSRVAAIGEVFTEVMQQMPERIRWETQLFMLEASRTGALGTASEDFTRLSLAIESLAETAKDLPATVSADLETLIASSGTAIEQARGLVTDTRAMLAELDGPLESARETSTTLTSAGAAWTTAGTAVDAAMTTISDMGGDDSPEPAGLTPETDDSFEVSDLTDAGNSLDAAAVEIRGLLADMGSAESEAAVSASLDAATLRLEELVDTVTLRAIYVVVVLLVGAFLIRRYGLRRGPAA
jgi:hypothetical protein